MRENLHVVWFKRDLRVVDHPPLAAAAARGPVLPLFVAETAWWAEPDMAARHWAFAAECLAELRAALADLGQPLILRIGDIVETLAAFHRSHGIATLHSHEETGGHWTYARDRRVAAWARAHGIPWHEYPQTGVIRRLPSRDGWAKRWDRRMAEPEAKTPTALRPLGVDPGTIPTATDLGLAPDPCPERQPGGRAAGLERLESFLHRRGQPYRAAMSSPVTGFAACSRLSPHLAWGSLAMREVAQATWARQRQLKADDAKGGWRGSMSSFSGRLHWHCHFMQKLEDQPQIEREDLHPAYRGLRPSEPDPVRLRAWAAGETGLPFVDACMRCLRATGWMNFRMRAMLMAVASYHLWLPWRASGFHLARLFTDYEPGIHWPQSQMQSGTTGINTVRIYNPVKQGQDQDPDGRFTRAWVPQLAEVPDRFLQEPWRWEDAPRRLRERYPAPIVDHQAAAKAAKEKIYAVRRGAEHRTTSDAIQAKHGSRKSGIPNRGQSADGRRRGGRRQPSADQLALFPEDGG